MEVQGLLGLPMELLALICSFLPDDDVLPYALTCRMLNESALDELRPRQKIFDQYKIITDEDPLVILEALRSTVSDPFKANCVRHIRFSYMRLHWPEWKDPLSQDPMGPIDEWKSYYTHDELENYRRLLRTHIFPGISGNTLSNAHVSMLRHGEDDPLKLLLMALCPRLVSVTLSKHPPYRGRRARSHPFAHSFLAQHQAIHRIFHRQAQTDALNPQPRLESWPLGLAHLRSVSLCAPLEARGAGQPYHLRPENISGLLWLPSISNLELRYLEHRYNGDEHIDVEVGCSSVKKLTFDHCAIQQSTLLRLITASRSLEDVSVKRCGVIPGQLENWLRNWYPSSLTKVLLE